MLPDWMKNSLDTGGDTTAGYKRQGMIPKGGGTDWLKKLLPILGALGGGALMGMESRGVKAPHGGTAGSKPIMAQGLHAFAKSIEEQAKAKQLIAQASEEKKQQDFENRLKQEQFDLLKQYRQYQMTPQQEKTPTTKEQYDEYVYNIQLKAARGEDLTPGEEAFLAKLDETDPMEAARIRAYNAGAYADYERGKKTEAERKKLEGEEIPAGVGTGGQFGLKPETFEQVPKITTQPTGKVNAFSEEDVKRTFQNIQANGVERGESDQEINDKITAFMESVNTERANARYGTFDNKTVQKWLNE
jgi:hypothetical protein